MKRFALVLPTVIERFLADTSERTGRPVTDLLRQYITDHPEYRAYSRGELTAPEREAQREAAKSERELKRYKREAADAEYKAYRAAEKIERERLRDREKELRSIRKTQRLAKQLNEYIKITSQIDPHYPHDNLSLAVERVQQYVYNYRHWCEGNNGVRLLDYAGFLRESLGVEEQP